ncbi:hypothetical protein CPB86DRAFT_788340 [Serendipita vermifera]|nr:hypothetical protein CPB86DRAFT_788340 [Serendipita vermifera]
MSTSWQYAPLSYQDSDSGSKYNQSYSSQYADASEYPSKDTSKLRREDTERTFTNNTLHIPNWPGPQTLEKTRGEKTLYILGYILFLIPPICFLVLVLSAIGLHSRKSSPFGIIISQACLLGPTIFPIAFSAILGWCLRVFGRYRAERGIKLGQLERIVGSQTLFSYLRFVAIFKQFDVLCMVLGVLWSLSPLGGQGILRMLSKTQVSTKNLEDIRYLDLYGESDFSSASGTSLFRSAVDALYVAALYAPAEVKNGTTDLWGGIKIPLLDSTEFDHQGDGGVAVGGFQTYASLLGVPVNSTFKSVSGSTFTLNTTFFTTQCEEPKMLNRTIMSTLRDGATFMLQTQASFSGTVQRNISLITFPADLPNAVLHNCTLTPNFVLATVECLSGHCGVSRLKRIADSDGQLARTVLSNTATWTNIALSLPSSTGRQHPGYSSQTERYLNDPQASQGDNDVVIMDLSQIPIAEFNKRLTTVFNTYYQATISPRLRIGSLIPDDRFMNNPLQVTTATVVTLSPETYLRHWEWVISAGVASLVMLSIAITGISLELKVMSPDIYGYVASMTRDSPYFSLPPNGCTLESTQRAVLLKDLIVRFEDVAPNKEVGHLAFTMAGYQTPTQQPTDCRLRKTRVYSGDS